MSDGDGRELTPEPGSYSPEPCESEREGSETRKLTSVTVCLDGPVILIVRTTLPRGSNSRTMPFSATIVFPFARWSASLGDLRLSMLLDCIMAPVFELQLLDQRPDRLRWLCLLGDRERDEQGGQRPATDDPFHDADCTVALPDSSVRSRIGHAASQPVRG